MKKKIKFKKYKLLIYLIIIIFHTFFAKIKFFLIPYILNNEYKTFENYLKACNYSGYFSYAKTVLSTIPKISIISPVFNTGKFALRFLRSIQYQNFNDIEIILTDYLKLYIKNYYIFSVIQVFN